MLAGAIFIFKEYISSKWGTTHTPVPVELPVPLYMFHTIGTGVVEPDSVDP